MELLAAPIRISVYPSRTVARLVDGAHVLFVLAFAGLFPVSVLSLMAALAVIVSLMIERHSRRKLEADVDSVLLHSNGQWSVALRRGSSVAAQLEGPIFVSPYLVILSLAPEGANRIRVVLARDNTQAESFRRLRVRLRMPLDTR